MVDTLRRNFIDEMSRKGTKKGLKFETKIIIVRYIYYLINLPMQKQEIDKETLIKAFDPLADLSLQLLEKAEKSIIETPDDLLQATGLKKEITTQEKAIDEKKSSILAPAKEFVNAVTGYAKELLQPLDTAKQIISNKVLEYNKIQEQKRREEQERIRKEQEELRLKQEAEQKKIEEQRLENERKQKELAEKENELSDEELRLEKKRIAIENEKLKLEQERQAELARKETEENERKAKMEQERLDLEAKANKPKGIRTIRQFEVIDKKLVPIEFLDVNDTKVNQVIKLGTREIPGINIYSKEILW